MHYEGMHNLLDIGNETRLTIYCAHQTLEHGMKALISALGHDYEHTHDLNILANQISLIDTAQTWRFSSNLEQLNLYAGRDPLRHTAQSSN